jgi:hypothetical protein
VASWQLRAAEANERFQEALVTQLYALASGECADAIRLRANDELLGQAVRDGETGEHSALNVSVSPLTTGWTASPAPAHQP